MKTNKIFIVLALFACAMGFLESSVVIYLRELFYPEGFRFPIKEIPLDTSVVELFRELATLVMLFTIAYLIGKNKLERFAYFCFAFAIWDLFYYVFLYVFLAWPESLFTWDLLFLIPIPWIGPVWAPCLISFLMLISSVLIVKKQERDTAYRVKPIWWLVLLAGGFICIVSFTIGFLNDLNLKLSDVFYNIKKYEVIYSYVPKTFNSPLFFLGFSMMLYAVVSQFINPLKFFIHEKK